MKYTNLDPICQKKITELMSNGQIWDLHSSADFIGYKYDEFDKELTLTWEYGSLEDDFMGIVELKFKNVTYILINGKDPEIPREEDLCMEWLYLDDEEIVIEFKGGQSFSITCDEVIFQILDTGNSLRDLEGPAWAPDCDDRCYELLETPLMDLSVDDLRTLIRQNVGLSYLVPLAIKKLKVNLMIEGELNPGYLLQSILQIQRDFWQKHSTLKLAVEELMKRQIKFLKSSLEEFQR